MLRRWRMVGVCGLAVVALFLAGLAYRRTPPVRVLVVREVPAKAQRGAQDALAAAGVNVVAEPVWGGAEAAWQAPASYRLYFAAADEDAGVEVYAAEARVDGEGNVAGVAGIRALTRTPAGEETAPVLADGWLAFGTRVAERYQSITCLSLAESERQDVYAFAQPVARALLAWGSEPATGLTLEVVAGSGADEKRLVIDPSRRSVTPAEADLQYLPVIRGEQAWLPNLVSRVRELPGVGPEKIAFLENVFFTLTDKVTRLLHRRDSMPVAAVEPTASPTVEQASPEPTSGEDEPTSTPTTAATLTPTPTPTPAGTPLADGIVWRGTVKPDPQRPYADVEIVDIDPAELQIRVICGTQEPKPSTGLVGTGVIPQEDWPLLVAGFNGGFAAMHGQYGLMIDRKVYLPAREAIATLAIYEDGSIKMGTWGKDLVLTADMVSYRQNCPPLIKDGIITAETGKLTLWGLSVANEVYLYRSGLGVTEDGHLVYVAGKPLTAYTLARALQMAGARYAMQLDVDEYHVAFFTYNVQTDASGSLDITGHKLRSDMRGFDGYFLRPFQLDFFYLVRRPEPLAQAVRFAAPPATPAATPVLEAHDLPGRIAFASDRDGNWEIYTMQAGQPGSARRLTTDPADDLHPAWSPDGRLLAFTTRRDGNAEIYVLDVAGGSSQRVTRQGSEEWAPSWSPDGRLLAYQSDRNGQSDVYVCSSDGGDEVRLTPMEGNHEAPAWSPDGQRLVIDSDLDVSELVHASINLYIMGADGSNPYRILSNAEFPRWSPDGRTIAFISRRTGRWQVFLVNADGSGLRQLTRGNYDARYPAWSPDGRWVAFAGNEDGHWELYAISVDGGELVRLTATAKDSTYPAWAP